MQAIIIVEPGDELKLFSGVLFRATAETLIVQVEVRTGPTEVGLVHRAAAGLGESVIQVTAIPSGGDERWDPVDLAPKLASVFERFSVGMKYTYAIQGEAHNRVQADVAYAVWLATSGIGARFLAKHTTRIVECIPVSPQTVVSVYKLLLHNYALRLAELEFDIQRSECYTEHSCDEARIAYYELSHGLVGVQQLLSMGETNPWSYEGSTYAGDRVLHLLHLLSVAQIEIGTPVSVCEVGPARGHLTRKMLELPIVQRLLSIEANPHFCHMLRAELGGNHRLVVRCEDMRKNADWDYSVAIFSDCLDHYLTPAEQFDVISNALRNAPYVIIAGEEQWANKFVDDLVAYALCAELARAGCSGTFEPLRPGYPVYCPRPPWKAYLLRSVTMRKARLENVRD